MIAGNGKVVRKNVLPEGIALFYPFPAGILHNTPPTHTHIKIVLVLAYHHTGLASRTQGHVYIKGNLFKSG
jgi:hypothetical protein